MAPVGAIGPVGGNRTPPLGIYERKQSMKANTREDIHRATKEDKEVAVSGFTSCNKFFVAPVY